MITGVQDVYLNVVDMERALAFYEGILGLRVIERSPWWSALDVGGVRVGLHGTGGRAVPELERDAHGPLSGAVLTLRCSDIDQAVTDLDAADVCFLGPVTRHPWGALVPFTDPDGNILKLMEPPQHPQWRQGITFLPTTDLSAMHTFYSETLGLELALDQGTCRIYRIARDAYLGVCQRADATRAEGVIVTLVTPDVEERCAALEAAGVSLEKPCAYNAAYDITQAFLRDPEGHLVELQRFDDPRWAG